MSAETSKAATTAGWWGAIPMAAKVGFIASVLGFTGGLVFALEVLMDDGAPLAVHVAPRVAEGNEHLALDGDTVITKAVLGPRPGHVLRYRWDFGDGSDRVEGVVTDPYAVGQVHKYPASPPGTTYTATLTVEDTDTGEKEKTTYPIRFVEKTTENKRSIALDDALWALHGAMVREQHPVHGEIGHWKSRHPVGTTAMSVLAFEVNGFDSRDEREDNPYRETVDRALTYVLAHCRTVKIAAQPAGDPDTNGNGLGITVAQADKEMYELPLVVMALVASQAPDRVARSGPDGVIGRSFRDLVTDMLDYLAFAQCDRKNASRGGWRYRANASDADMSVTQWPVLAFMSAEQVWGIAAPEWVRSELRDGYLASAQAKDGGFGYTRGKDRDNVGLTGAGLIGLAFAGVESDDDRVRRAIAYVDRNWNKRHLGNSYAMYALMKAAHLQDPGLERYGDHHWLTEYVDHLYAKQRDDGSWPADGFYATGPLATAWPALIISKDVFATSRPSTLFWKIVIPVAGTALLGIGLVVLWRRRRAVADLA